MKQLSKIANDRADKLMADSTLVTHAAWSLEWNKVRDLIFTELIVEECIKAGFINDIKLIPVKKIIEHFKLKQ